VAAAASYAPIPGFRRPAPQTSEPVQYSLTPITAEDFARDAFPGEIYKAWDQWKPSFQGADLYSSADCTKPHPSIYFNNPKSASFPLFHDQVPSFPMAMDYISTSDVARPQGVEKQTVLGFAEMQWPYYQHIGTELETKNPYLVISVNAYNYTEVLNYQFAECGLLGWPNVREFRPGLYPLRVVLKNSYHGLNCLGWTAGHAECNLATSWGHNPAKNNWRNTAKEINELIELCTKKYICDIQKASLTAGRRQGEIPQVFLFRAVGEKILSTAAITGFNEVEERIAA